MKIIIIGPAHPLRGGIADTNEELCRSLIIGGNQSEIFSFKLQYPSFLFPGKSQFSSSDSPADIKIRSVINSINPINWFKTAKEINKTNPDVVIIRYWLPFMAPCLGSIARLLKKSIKIISLTDNIIPHEKRIGDQHLTNYFKNSCNGFVTMSSTVKNQLNRITTKPVISLPHPILNIFGKKVDKETACKKLGLNPQKRYLLFFGLIRKYKGLDILIKSLANPDVKKLDLNLIIAGEFYETPEYYLDLIKKLNLKNNIIINNKFISNNRVKYYFSAVDIVTQTYRSATQSGITQIGYNFECPMLVTNVGGLGEIIPHNKVGYVVKPSANEIAMAIIDFFKNNRKEEFSKNAAIEKEKFKWEAFTKKLIEFITSI